ncbi:unnamed protein product [Parnassius apollo]|uniref:(apollo) hypothetical protein n=1 Tax=Parnassius apollo TaxID=110799 RepID=A0A8S3VZ34_PARAO|nr:unnamed protein product [Parnassius apollo]
MKKYYVNVTTENSFASLQDDDEETSLSATLLNHSFPILNTNVYQELEEYKLKLTEKQEQLQITENELEELLSENVKLKEELQTYRRNNARLIKFGNSPIPSHKYKKNNKVLNSTPNASPNKDQLIATLKDEISCLEIELEKIYIELNFLRHYIELIDVKELTLLPKNVPFTSTKSSKPNVEHT